MSKHSSSSNNSRRATSSSQRPRIEKVEKLLPKPTRQGEQPQRSQHDDARDTKSRKRESRPASINSNSIKAAKQTVRDVIDLEDVNENEYCDDISFEATGNEQDPVRQARQTSQQHVSTVTSTSTTQRVLGSIVPQTPSTSAQNAPTQNHSGSAAGSTSITPNAHAQSQRSAEMTTNSAPALHSTARTTQNNGPQNTANNCATPPPTLSPSQNHSRKPTGHSTIHANTSTSTTSGNDVSRPHAAQKIDPFDFFEITDGMMNWLDLNAVEQDGEEILIDTKELYKIIKNFDLLSFANHVRYHHSSSLFYIDWKKSSIVFKCRDPHFKSTINSLLTTAYAME